MKPLETLLNLLAKLCGGAAAILAIVGIFYSNDLMGLFNLSPEAIDIRWQNYIYIGYLLIKSFSPSSLAISLIPTTVFMFLIAIPIKVEEFKHKESYFTRIKKDSFKAPVFFCIFYALILPAESAKLKAHEIYNLNTEPSHITRQDNTEKAVSLILCGSAGCAFYDPSSQTAFISPWKDIKADLSTPSASNL